MAEEKQEGDFWTMEEINKIRRDLQNMTSARDGAEEQLLRAHGEVRGLAAQVEGLQRELRDEQVKVEDAHRALKAAILLLCYTWGQP